MMINLDHRINLDESVVAKISKQWELHGSRTFRTNYTYPNCPCRKTSINKRLEKRGSHRMILVLLLSGKRHKSCRRILPSRAPRGRIPLAASWGTATEQHRHLWLEKVGWSLAAIPWMFFHMSHFNGKIRGRLLMSFSAFKNCWASGSLDMSFCNFSIIQTSENLPD